MQAAVCLLLFHDFLFGRKYFAFMDVGGDFYAQFLPHMIHLATPANWASAWSFNIGLGGVAPFSPGPFTLLAIAGGPDHVLDLRLWVYLAKIFVGGAAFYGFALAIGSRRETAQVAGLAYSFCSFITIDGQWDPLSTEFAAYALILWALASHRKDRSVWPIPLSIMFAAYGGVFMFSAGVFVVFVFIAASIASDRPGLTVRTWLVSILPQCIVGILLSAPVMLPAALQLLASPRVTGMQAGFGDRLREMLSTNDSFMILIELAGLFNKNLLGVGDQHFGWMNYLESPGSYVGMLPLLLIPQLWRGERADRRILVAAGLALGLYFVLPAIRYAAFGFGLDYFRVNNLWAGMLLLALFARALEVVALRGLGLRLLAATATVLALTLVEIHTSLSPLPSLEHELRIAAAACAGLILLGASFWRKMRWPQFAAATLMLVAAESVLVNYPSYHKQRQAVTRETPGYYSDGTISVLGFLKARDPGFYRVEKTYISGSLCDALVQGYMGVKSYWSHSAGVIGYFIDLQLIDPHSRIKNFTNYLPNFGDRFVLNTLNGVKYMLSKAPIDWPGFRQIHQAQGILVYENELALPLGVVHDRQYLRRQIAQLSTQARDITMVNAVIVDQLRGDRPRVFHPLQLMKPGPNWLEDNYIGPAKLLHRRGLVIEEFSAGRVAGRIDSDVHGILVLSIPYSRGWSVAVDGIEQPVYSAQLGMLATDIAAGPHRVEVRFSLPGLMPGLLAALFGLLALSALVARVKRSRAAPASSM